MMSVDAFLDAFVRWVREQPDVEAAALVGSHARGDARDESDVDLVILTADPARYLRDPSWVSWFGETVERREEDWGRLTSLRVGYVGGLEVEFGFATPDWAAVLVDAGTAHVISGGMKILHDPQGILGVSQRAVSGSPGA